MERTVNPVNRFLVVGLCVTALQAMLFESAADDFAEAEQLFTDYCAVCHGADRGGYIGPALNSEETILTDNQISACPLLDYTPSPYG